MAGLFRLLRDQYTPPTNPTGLTLAGKTVLLTGATAGLGFEAAIKLLNLGVSSLIISSRNLDRGLAVKTDLERRTNRPGVIQVWELEMGSFQSVKSFAARVDRDVERLDVALLNAGLFNREYSVSPESGWEETLQVNVLSTSLLALLLLPMLRRSATTVDSPTHLTVVSSQQFVRAQAESLRTEGPLLEHLNDPGRFAGPTQYAISKLMLEYALKTIAGLTRGEDGTVPVIVNTVSPGFCVSNLGRQFNRFYERWVMWVVQGLFARTTEQGSRLLISGTSQGVEAHGKCWRNDGYLDESKALTVGDEGRQFQTKAWKEIVAILQEQADVEGIIKGL